MLDFDVNKLTFRFRDILMLHPHRKSSVIPSSDAYFITFAILCLKDNSLYSLYLETFTKTLIKHLVMPLEFINHLWFPFSISQVMKVYFDQAHRLGK